MGREQIFRDADYLFTGYFLLEYVCQCLNRDGAHHATTGMLPMAIAAYCALRLD